VLNTSSPAEKWLKKNYNWITEIKLGELYYAKLDHHSDVVIVNYLSCQKYYYIFVAGYVRDGIVGQDVVLPGNDWSKASSHF
jgi:hypothetical protein